MAINPEDARVAQKYAHLLNNTGGNDPMDLLRRLDTERNLATTNIFVFTLAAAVQSQVTLLRRLEKEGMLS